MQADLPGGGVVFDATDRVDDWETARRRMLDAFAVSQSAAQAQAPIIYLVHGDDLLGRRGAPSAMVATGLLSAARTAAIELSRKGAVANVISVDDDIQSEMIDLWVSHLVDEEGPTGQIVHLTRSHLGKALA